MATTCSTETDAMRRAIALSARALGATAPDPVVGCVILDTAGAVVGEGRHRRAGGPHAEVHALRAADGAARGGTAVVTHEPCNHTGRTGPCVQALIEAGAARVVHAVFDPDPAASGGAQTPRAAGVDTGSGPPAAEAEAVGITRLASVRRGRPYVHWTYAAATLDGRIAAADGSSRWTTSPGPRADVHRLQAEADAVVVGSRARVTRDARVTDGTAPTLVAVPKDAEAAHPAGADVVRLPYAHGKGPGLDIAALSAELHARGVRSVLPEGGPTLAGALVGTGAVDAVVGDLAPALLGADPDSLGRAGISTTAQALRLDVTDVARLGPDLRITAVPTAAQEK